MLVKLKQHLIMFALTREIQQNINFVCQVIVGHELVNTRLFLAAFRYFSIILFRTALVFGEDVNLHQ